MIEETKFSYYLTPILYIWLFVFFLLLSALPFALLIDSGILPVSNFGTSLLTDIFLELALVVVVISALMMMFKVIRSLDFYLIFVRKENALAAFTKGTLLGLLLISICVGALYLNKNVTFVPANLAWNMVLGYLIFFLLIAVFEEFLFRTIVLFLMADRYPLWFSAVVNAVLFSLAHFFNPGATYLGLFNIFLAGLLFTVLTLQTRNIAWVVGIHFSWNFAQSVLFGFNVSGNDKISGLVKAQVSGVDYLSGGGFGVEGSVFCTAVFGCTLLWIIYKNGLGYLEYYDEEDEDIDTETKPATD
jgi:membrane protease YdiL (CAAX protease family)